MVDNSLITEYGTSSIQVLEGLEAVRRRPGMYVGGTDIKALHHLVYEVVDNSIDEALAGICNQIAVTIQPDSSVTVEDNGRGIPVGPHSTQKDKAGRAMDTLDVVMTILHAGGKFGGGGYKVSGGLHGVGVSAVNALSEWCEVEVRRESKLYKQRYARGVPEGKVALAGKVGAGEHGTRTTFKFDTEIFKEAGLDYRFETLVACHLLKAVEGWTDMGLGKFSLHYLRDKQQREVDFLVANDGHPWFLVEAIDFLVQRQDGKWVNVAEWTPSEPLISPRGDGSWAHVLRWREPKESVPTTAHYEGRNLKTAGAWQGKYGARAAWIPSVYRWR